MVKKLVDEINQNKSPMQDDESEFKFSSDEEDKPNNEKKE